MIYFEGIKVLHFNAMIEGAAKYYGYNGYEDFKAFMAMFDNEKNLKKHISKIPYQEVRKFHGVGKIGLKAIAAWLEMDGLAMLGTPKN